MPGGKGASNNSPFKYIFNSVSKRAPYALVAGTIVGALFAKVPGAAGFLAGSCLVHIWFMLDIFVAIRAEKKSMTEVARRLLIAYLLKAMLGMVVLVLFPLPALVRHGWLLVGAVTTVIIWLVLSMTAIMKMRILYFDDSD